MKTIKVALFGLGTIGTGVAKILHRHSDRLTRATGKKIELAKICDRDLTTRRDIELPPGIMTDDAESIVADPNISVAIELIGGIEPARTFVLRLLENGKDGFRIIGHYAGRQSNIPLGREITITDFGKFDFLACCTGKPI